MNKPNYLIFSVWTIRHVLLLVLCLLTSSIIIARSASASSNIVSGKISVSDRKGKDVTVRSNVVVFIDGLNLQQLELVDKTPYLISHKNRQFSPRVLPILKGQVLDFYNDDSIFHNVFSLSKANTFDLGIYPEGTSKLVTFNRSGLVKIYCNIHPNMISNILVLNNSLFTRTNNAGEFEIKNVPDGDITIRIWHENGDEASKKITVSGGKRFEESFQIVETKFFRPHKNKFGKTYKSKY